MEDKKIETCLLVIEKLFKLLGAMGAAFISLVGMFLFLTEQFGVLVAKLSLGVLAVIMFLILLLIYDKLVIIKKTNLSRSTNG